MNEGPKVKGNPLRITVGLLVVSYIVGEFIIPKYPIIYFVKLIGVIGLITSTVFFFTGFNIFKTYDEDPVPTSSTNKIIFFKVIFFLRDLSWADWIVGPSAIGSVKGTPTSITSTPAETKPCINSSVDSKSGSPATKYATKALRALALSLFNFNSNLIKRDSTHSSNYIDVLVPSS